MKRLRRLALMLFTLAALAAATLFVVVQPGVTPRPSTPPAADAQRLREDVKRLSVDFYPRSYDRPENLERVATYLRAEFERAGARVGDQPVIVEGQTYRNVVARFGPDTGPLRVIGAHYDSYADTGVDSGDPRGYSPRTHTPGADDNASGVAGLLELARMLGRAPPSRPVELVAYTLEEPPHFRSEHMGSAWHARALRAQGREVEFMLSLEMIGRFSDRPGSQTYPVPGMHRLYSDRGDFVVVVGRMGDFGLTRKIKAAMAGATPLPVHSINAPPLLVQGVDFSDHLSYWREGFPALMIGDTAFLRSRRYHQPDDTYETLDYARMAQVVQGAYAAATAP
ncbi:M20/M25/M40 family metallo-hydrolase [Lysobacter sp. K5869]|uniref:M20/M25/M40 family metallo-hydrolase n=1 Tax=Lysobacter sp. K5869 TaxID=2820808 RepID=UPI001C05EFF4|nr:M20/M25/M40 family metallo-hydrolase [Lysobacter sp. K5869]QWP76246.1 M20/M25/M40 family metallo-hydrolase [Lysobacter sp. K5869]